MSEVISVGGAFPEQNVSWRALSYASSGTHPSNPNRHCPDFTSIVGQSPKGIIIVVPTMAGAIFDQSFSGGVFPHGDETGGNEGWMVAIGTSSSAPMVAGAAALLLEAKSSLAPAEIKQALADTSIDVVEGESASGKVAGVGPDSATGAGRIDIGAAVDSVKPVSVCPRAPIIVCKRAPICHRAPLCYRAPFVCRKAPIMRCVRAPIARKCQPAPVRGCAAAPYKKQIDPRVRRPLDDKVRPMFCALGSVVHSGPNRFGSIHTLAHGGFVRFPVFDRWGFLPQN